MKNKQVWGLFLRKPTFGEWLILAMSAMLAVLTIYPGLPFNVYRIMSVVCCFGFFLLFLRETQCENPRYFYKWLWALFGIVKVNVKFVDGIFIHQTWQLFDVVLIIVLLRSIHTYNVENDRKPLFFAP
ncbi:hypothetical protein [Larkinella rosea]|uniref:Uncharacterized protein n=1 Tax=Larkinella rosea TaxID=2025312 RepID=A0A3P1C3V9_9BACT|nr:hypothetical protein [Larkinella rosea]RRB07716.1 hypothetical protein EHT25_08060 [Larkinella rosea]